MRSLVRSAIVLLAPLLASCSNNPTRPAGPPPATDYTPSIEIYADAVTSILGAANGDLYVSGGELMRLRGSRADLLELPEGAEDIGRIWRTVDGAVYALGDDPNSDLRVYRQRGDTWDSVLVPTVDISALWGAPTGELFAADYGGQLYHYDGSAWTADSLPIPATMRGIAGRAANDVYAVGEHGVIGHFDGSKWTAQSVDSTLLLGQSTWTAPGRPLYMLGFNYPPTLYTYDGGQLGTVPLPPGYQAQALSDGSSYPLVWAYSTADQCYALLRFDGAQWTQVRCGAYNFNCAWSADTGPVYAGYDGVLWQVDGGSEHVLLGQPDHSYALYGSFWGTPADGVFVVGTRALRYYDGHWSDLDKESITSEPAYSVSGTSAADLWAVGGSMILHYDGRSWSLFPGAQSLGLTAVCARSPRDVLAVGLQGAILHYDGASWQPMASPTTADLYTMWAWRGGAVAAGRSGVVIEYDGSAWRQVATPMTWDVNCLFGFGPDQIYAVGDDGSHVAFFSGTRWTLVPTPFSGSNVSMWGTSRYDFFVGQEDGTVMHFARGGWSRLPHVVPYARRLWGTPEGDLLVATQASLIRYTKTR